MSYADLLAFAIWASLVLYLLLAGADFGGGVWDLLATGPRKSKQRDLVESAIAPVWEANHVWLILVVVLLFSGFPSAFSAITTALHVPLTLMLIGVVLRGAAFTFRHYDPRQGAERRFWGRVFSVSSFLTPVFLGICVGALSAGGIHARDGVVTSGFFSSWIGWFQLSVGAFALALFSFLAAVYLAVEAEERALREDFRLRALIAGVAVAMTALTTAWLARSAAPAVGEGLLFSRWAWPLQGMTALSAVGALACLWVRQYRLARGLAIAQVALIMLGWGLGQYPYLVVPDFAVAGAAAPDSVLRLLLIALAAGGVLLFPSLYWLMRVFKGSGR